MRRCEWLRRHRRGRWVGERKACSQKGWMPIWWCSRRILKSCGRIATARRPAPRGAERLQLRTEREHQPFGRPFPTRAILELLERVFFRLPEIVREHSLHHASEIFIVNRQIELFVYLRRTRIEI